MNDIEPLTPREQEVFVLVTQGYTNSEIAELLFISTNTVQSHVRSILAKLGVQSRIQALHKAYYFVPRDPDLFCEQVFGETRMEHATVSLPRSSSAQGEQPSPRRSPLTSANLISKIADVSEDSHADRGYNGSATSNEEQRRIDEQNHL